MRKILILISFIAVSLTVNAIHAQPQTHRSAGGTVSFVGYENADFNPPLMTLRGPCEKVQVFNLRNQASDGGRKGSRGFNDKISSMKWSVPAGYEIRVCQNEGYDGWCETLTGTGEKANVGSGMNDSISSIRCRAIGTN